MADRDITHSFANFREAARHLWNVHYRPILAACDRWDFHDSFDRVCVELFDGLVLRPNDIADAELARSNSWSPKTIRTLCVVPSPASGVPIMINRDRPASGYWDHPKQRIAMGDARLRFARFFDFDVLGFRDFRYCEVVIDASVAEPDLADRWALIEFEHVRVFVDEQ